MSTAVIQLASSDVEAFGFGHGNTQRSDSLCRAVDQAAATLDAGGLVAFPTETVYGVAARADLPDALEKLRLVKSRQDNRPFTVHIGSPSDAAKFIPEVKGVASRLVRKGWPGPLTLILAVDDPFSAPVMANLEASVVAGMYFERTIGLRCPDDPVAERILRLTRGPVVASSANAAGTAAPRCGGDVLRDLDGRIDLLIDGGNTKYAKPSTIVRVDGSWYTITREGVLDAGIIERMAKLRILLVCTGNTCRSPMAEGIAGMMLAAQFGCGVDELAGRGVEVRSAGTSGGDGCGAAPYAVSVTARRGIDLSGHVSKGLTADMVHQADVIFTMTRSHRTCVLDLVPSAQERVFLLLGERDVQDPVGGSEEEYEECAKVIEEGLTIRLQEVIL
jgi:protein-tyrosine phosphatase